MGLFNPNKNQQKPTLPDAKINFTGCKNFSPFNFSIFYFNDSRF